MNRRDIERWEAAGPLTVGALAAAALRYDTRTSRAMLRAIGLSSAHNHTLFATSMLTSPRPLIRIDPAAWREFRRRTCATAIQQQRPEADAYEA